ncbi:MAG: hypothetical protein IPL31_10460 [Saprospiraceae bacterium]|nr:hypothetical protein [Saprospiraceae bacterium]
MGKTIHSAPGPMAGYLFQPDRALVILSGCNNNQSVTIELIDDLAIIDDKNNIVYREQDKSSMQKNGQTFRERSKDLWRTLQIWTNEVATGLLDPQLTLLCFVTNKILENNSLAKKISEAKDSTEILEVITLLKNAAKKPPFKLKAIIEDVLSKEAALKKIIPCIQLIDGNSYDERNELIANSLGLNDDIRQDVITDLRGWLNEQIIEQLDQGKSPIIKRVNFNQRVQRARQNAGDKRIKVLAKRFVELKISEDQLNNARLRTFAKQLEVIEHYDKTNIIIDAINDFFFSESERTRLTAMGDLTKQEFQAIDDSSKERWKEVFRRKMIEYQTSMPESEMSILAYKIYDGTIDGYLARIRGETTEAYFTRGSLHKLSDDLEIGWHPEWRKIFINE